MKDIEDEIPFAVPEGWAWCRLGEVCELKGGKRIPAGLSTIKEKTSHIYIRVTDMKNNSISDEDLVYITDEIYEKIQRYTISKNDLYLTIAGSIGRVGIVPDKFDGMNLTENALKLTNISVDKKYLMLILNSPFVQDYFESTYHQVAMPKLSLVNASKTFIPLPPLSEQHRIVTAIEAIFTQIALLEQNKVDLQTAAKQAKSKILDLAIRGKLVLQDPADEPASVMLERLRAEKEAKIAAGEIKRGKNDSYIYKNSTDNCYYQKFTDGYEADISDEIPFDVPDGWAWCRLGEIYYHTTGKALKKSNEKGSLKKYITTSNLYWDTFDLSEVRTMYFTDDELDKYTIKKGDLVLCNGGDVGRAAIWSYDKDICYQNHISRMRPKTNGIENRFFLYVLKFYKEQNMLKGKGIGISSLSASDLLSVIIPLSSLFEQQRIVAKIEELFAKLDFITAVLTE